MTKRTRSTSADGQAYILPLTPAHLVGLGAFQLAIPLAFWQPWLAAIPLAIFVLLCLIAPFCWRIPFFLPVIFHGPRDRRRVALTFDDGPDPATTIRLLELLREQKIRACFFLVGERIKENPQLVRAILADGHEIGNHSQRHDPLLMLRKTATLRQDIDACQAELQALGVRALAFRPPIGIVNPRLWRLLLQRGLFCVNFSRRALDFGNRRMAGCARKIIKGVRSGDIIMMHDRLPSREQDIEAWLLEVSTVIHGVQARGLRFEPLSAVIGRPVCMPERENARVGAVTGFYDALAKQYDTEQRRASHALMRRLERRQVERNLYPSLDSSDCVLEIGAGTGRFSIPLAQQTSQVTALDISSLMLARLKEKAEAENLSNLQLVEGDYTSIREQERYNCVCSFSALEYIPDLEPFFKQACSCLQPGGILYFTTAHRSFFRFWTQVGNALRQGIWLCARSKRKLKRQLKAAGFEVEIMQDLGLKSLFSSGMLVEVRARKPEEKNEAHRL